MRTSLKVLISLVISLAVFSGLLFLTASDYESFTETKIYKPAILRHVNENLEEIERAFIAWNETNTELFKNFLREESLMSAVKQDQDRSDIEERNNVIAKIISTIPGFAGLRIIDSQYQKIHFSTFPEDILNKTNSMLSYKKYNDTGNLIPYQHIASADKSEVKITASTAFDVILYCLPFYDTYDVYRGTAVFYISGNSFLYHLVSQNILSISDGLALLSDEAHTIIGILTGNHNVVSPELKEVVLNDWERVPQTLRIIGLEGEDRWVLITKKSDFGYIGRITEKNVFMFPMAVKYFLVFTVFVTIFLMFFLLLNLKRNKLFVAQNKIQQLHWSILKNYLKTSQKENWAELQKELEYHRHEVNAEIKKGLGKKALETKGKEIDDFLQNSWQEIFDIINKTSINKSLSQDLKNIKAEELINLLMEAVKTQKDGSDKPTPAAESSESPDRLSEVEKLDEIEEVETVEELDEIEEAETVEELDEIEEAETVEELDEIEEVKTVEELDEIEEAETVEELDEVEEAETVEDLDEIEEVETVEELDEAEEAETIEELDEAEEAETVEELDEIEEVETVEEVIDEIEDIDDPMLRLNDLGYTISGLDFSELDVPISELEKIEAKKVEYITDDYSPIRSMWGKYDDSPILGTLDVVGESEPVPLLDVNEEQTIVNEDGVFIIRKTEPVKPENKDFKALVDSVLR
ncbi:hypothetical protein E4O03_10150 [Treponema sp. OMZ 792]|uniref:hypothetical protein n=1 Tax=unclassified Treponema TaxID=2638727 RepID=UPI0020A27D85|nr:MULTISPECIES: hypothetical protein [unclassified Treponema]UTC74564.1 hypothetical protein E4O03_10150 [Treponema sp. OMZ 792]UTC80960.1 hypothetical protein E4O07_10060 [Treponema sp. OMZ 798]